MENGNNTPYTEKKSTLLAPGNLTAYSFNAMSNKIPLIFCAGLHISHQKQMICSSNRILVASCQNVPFLYTCLWSICSLLLVSVDGVVVVVKRTDKKCESSCRIDSRKQYFLCRRCLLFCIQFLFCLCGCLFHVRLFLRFDFFFIRKRAMAALYFQLSVTVFYLLGNTGYLIKKANSCESFSRNVLFFFVYNYWGIISFYGFITLVHVLNARKLETCQKILLFCANKNGARENMTRAEK